MIQRTFYMKSDTLKKTNFSNFQTLKDGIFSKMYHILLYMVG